MDRQRTCKLYYEDSPNYLVEYRGNFKEEIDKVSYACGDVITNIIGVVSTQKKNLDRLLKDVPSIVYIDLRSIYVLQDISPSNVDNINNIKINPYLNLTGNGILVGMVDSGIDYLNEEFIREDGTSRILNIWDQTIQNGMDTSVYMGETYSNEQINKAINAYKNNEDPYSIVPSKDEINHGTKMAGIIGARGYNNEFKGIAQDCEFVIVKLAESINYKNILEENGIKDVPVYNSSEVLAAINYLKNFSLQRRSPIVIYIGVGTSEGSHEGIDLVSKYITTVCGNIGIVAVAGTGNEGETQGHASGYIRTLGEIANIQLIIPKEIKYFSFSIWVRKPNRVSLNVISPTGEESNFIRAVTNKEVSVDFVFLDTEMTAKYYSPQHFTGHEVIEIGFNYIKAGIWSFQLRGDYLLTNARFDIWLPPHKTLLKGIRFLESDPFTTLNIPSMAKNVVSVAYHGDNNSLIATSGKGFQLGNIKISPTLATQGINILTTQVGGGITTVSGSSVATAIVAGVCALLLQWGIIDGNDRSMSSVKVITYLIYGANRSNPVYRYPNREIGYGYLDILGTFNFIGRNYTQYQQSRSADQNFNEYYINKLLVRIPVERSSDYK